MKGLDSRWLTSVEIDRMTVDLFRYWLERDWPTIIGNLHVLDRRETESSQYRGEVLIFWSQDNPNIFDHITTLNWEQIRTGTIIVEWVGEDRLSNQIQDWLTGRWNILFSSNA